MQQNNKQSASDKQKKAGQKMKEMAKQCKMNKEMQQEQEKIWNPSGNCLKI